MMIRDHFWLNDEQFSRLEPHLPTDTRGKPRVDDRRLIGGIIHILKSGGRWTDAPEVYGPRKTLYNRFVRWAAKGVWNDIFHALASAGGPPGTGPDRLISGQSPSLRQWWKRGERTQAIGRSRGGRTTKIHALSDGECRPIAFLLTGGQVADCKAGSLLLEQMPPSLILNGDKGYISNTIRRQVKERGTMPNIPPRVNRRWKNFFSPFLYRDRNAIEPCSDGSRTSGVSPQGTTAWPSITLPQSASSLLCATGYESGP